MRGQRYHPGDEGRRGVLWFWGGSGSAWTLYGGGLERSIGLRTALRVGTDGRSGLAV